MTRVDYFVRKNTGRQDDQRRRQSDTDQDLRSSLDAKGDFMSSHASEPEINVM